MKLRNKVLFILCFVLILLGLLVGCNSGKNPYDVNNDKGYTVSVKYDANGGFFTTNTSVIVDSYNINNVNKNDSGNAEIALLRPDDAARETDAFTATNNGYFLAGWYAQRIENTDADGNVYYTYADKWDFDNRLLEVDTSKKYNASEPYITLYAAWVPLFEIEFYDAATGELIKETSFNPIDGNSFAMPKWDEKTGKLTSDDIPQKTGFTFDGAYTDLNCENQITGDTIVHTGVFDEATGTATNTVMKVYIDWIEGDWYQIHTAEQFISNANIAGNYIIMADLDFTDKIWPTAFMHGNFTGSIQGNGHVFSNISFVQTNNAKANSGLFGQLSDGSSIKDIAFKNVSFTIKGGTRVVGTNYGLLAGSISSAATVENITIEKGTIIIDSQCYFGVDDYSIGLVCGLGDYSKVDSSDITCVAGGENPEKVQIEISGNQVSVVIS